eukprot:15339952-Alexandrium_andersonii.AAC.1
MTATTSWCSRASDAPSSSLAAAACSPKASAKARSSLNRREQPEPAATDSGPSRLAAVADSHWSARALPRAPFEAR